MNREKKIISFLTRLKESDAYQLRWFGHDFFPNNWAEEIERTFDTKNYIIYKNRI